MAETNYTVPIVIGVAAAAGLGFTYIIGRRSADLKAAQRALKAAEDAKGPKGAKAKAKISLASRALSAANERTKTFSRFTVMALAGGVAWYYFQSRDKGAKCRQAARTAFDWGGYSPEEAVLKAYEYCGSPVVGGKLFSDQQLDPGGVDGE